MTGRDVSDHDDKDGICVNCQLARALNEWRDAGGDVTHVVEAIRDVVHSIVYAALDEIFEDVDVAGDEKKAAH